MESVYRMARDSPFFYLSGSSLGKYSFGKSLTLLFQCTQLYLGNTGTYANKDPSYSYTQGVCQTPSACRNLRGVTGIPMIFVSMLPHLPPSGQSSDFQVPIKLGLLLDSP